MLTRGYNCYWTTQTAWMTGWKCQTGFTGGNCEIRKYQVPAIMTLLFIVFRICHANLFQIIIFLINSKFDYTYFFNIIVSLPESQRSPQTRIPTPRNPVL